MYLFIAESSCDVTKLNFNGNYKCSDDMEKNVCTLSCPQGSVLEPFKTTDVEYTCLYKTGEYEPKHIPQCIFGKYVKHYRNWSVIVRYFISDNM